MDDILPTIDAATDVRHDWTTEDILAVYELPLLELIAEASAVHRRHQSPSFIQKASLLSVKTGGCPGYRGRSSAIGTSQEGEAPQTTFDGDRRRLGLRSQGARGGRRSLLHGRGLALGAARVRVSRLCWRWCAASALSAWSLASRSACLACAGQTARRGGTDRL